MLGGELKLTARGLMRKNSPKIFLIAIIFIIVTMILSDIQLRLLGMDVILEQFQDQLEQIQTRLTAGEIFDFGAYFDAISSNFRLSGTFLSFLLGLMISMFYVGFISVCLKISRGIGADYRTLLDGFAIFFKLILLIILTRIFVLLWALLFFFPAIPAYYRYRQAYYILLDNPEKGVLQCIRESKEMMRGNKMDLFLLDLSFIGWFILSFIVGALLTYIGLFAFPIVMIWLRPYLGLTYAGYYNKLIKYSNDA
ncbi:MAG: DUF975 family protein [Oscillospiraceae bacterium]|nr:DUF975 family protein [Oscillospiraceae bacterium]